MFVSPPPATITGQLLSKRQSTLSHSSSSRHNNAALLQSIPEGSSTSYAPSISSSHSHEQPMYQQQELLQQVQLSQQQQQSMKKDSTNFVNAPPEYADRARDEIRKRLLPQSSNKSHRSTSSSKASSIFSSDRTADNQSLLSDNASSYQSSVFSLPTTVFTQSTAESSLLPAAKIVTQIALEDALPKTFYDMYTPEILMTDPSNILCNGRPKFTERELLDWELNDIRSLLIVEKCKPEWGNQLPQVVTNAPNLPQFRLQLLPLYSMDEFIIETLVISDLYLEANLDYQFKLTSAKYTVAAARKRHEQITGRNEPVMHLSKPEWRNIIENYLLNIAVEAQCRFDFKHRCSELKKFKAQQSNLKRPDMPPPSLIPNGKNGNHISMEMGNQSSTGSGSLLKKALMKNLQLRNFQKNNLDQNTINSKNNNSIQNNDQDGSSAGSMTPHQHGGKISLTKEEKAMLWSQCQAQVYQRLGLDWQPDGISQM